MTTLLYSKWSFLWQVLFSSSSAQSAERELTLKPARPMRTDTPFTKSAMFPKPQRPVLQTEK
jgi:hypothetical protein